MENEATRSEVQLTERAKAKAYIHSSLSFFVKHHSLTLLPVLFLFGLFQGNNLGVAQTSLCATVFFDRVNMCNSS